ncbi:MAG: hypothetical protein J0H43_11160 [Actinobacteria bacterium]|nr:hypothetical protein [Actinomycetota bacterium]
MLRAPAGFGKTTLIAHWLGESDPGADIVWARVRSGDHEPGGFWLMLLDALNDAGLPVPAQLGERSARATAERRPTRRAGWP